MGTQQNFVFVGEVLLCYRSSRCVRTTQSCFYLYGGETLGKCYLPWFISEFSKGKEKQMGL